MSSKHIYRNFKSDYQNLVPFVAASTETDVKSDKNKSTVASCHGEEIKNYYEMLINQEPRVHVNSSKLSNSKKRKCCKSENPDKNMKLQTDNKILSDRFQAEMLKFAQNGEMIKLKGSVEKGVNINYQDRYGWSALMCAAVEGHLKVVDYLLNIKADVSLKNNQFQTVRDLADKAKMFQICKLIDNFDSEASTTNQPEHVNAEISFCDICKSNFSDLLKHETSTAHLFNRQIKPQEPHFSLPESNKGFQMMLRHGWNKGQGLGSDGQGQKYPVKTVLKRDRHGLGAFTKQKSKITHFHAGDVHSIDKVHKNSERLVSARTLSARELRRKEKQDKQWEREMRVYFNTE